jgi:hypothetical protein
MPIYKKGESWKKALELFTIATQLKPDYAEAYQRMSEVSMQIGVPDDELKVCLKAVQKDPHNADAHLQLGMILLIKRNHFWMNQRGEYETTIGLGSKKGEGIF